MFKCEECGYIFEEPVTWDEDRGEYWGFPCSETLSGCPRCRGNYEEVFECEECGKWFLKGDIEDGLCDSCHDELYD